MRFLPIAAASLLLASCAATDAPAPPLPIRTAPNAQFIEGDLRYLASDALEGRQTGERGFDTAANYVAGRFEAIGLKPGGDDGTWFQRVDLRLKRYGEKNGNTIALNGPNAVQLTQIEDVLVTGRGAAESGSIEAPVIFVGQGFVDSEGGRDDLAGIDLTGKIALALYGAPEYLGAEEGAYYRSTRIDRLKEAGAIGVISLNERKADEEPDDWEQSKDYYFNYVTATWVGPDGTAFGSDGDYEVYATLRPDAGERLMARQPFSLEKAFEIANDPNGRFTPFDTGLTATMRWDQKFDPVESRNVIGMVEGADPALKDEYVVLTAHLDHVGMDDPHHGKADEDARAGVDHGPRDLIHNGAMDNASGVAIMLDVARRLAIDPPRRSVLFIALTAEEMGLVGSSYNAHYPTVPPGSVVANVNMDMPILTYEFVDAVAFGAERSTLYPVVKAAAARAGVELVPDFNPDEALFTRSDHYSYVEMGVPSVYLDTGPGNGGDEILETFLKEHYHAVSDEVELIDFGQAARFADINFEIAHGIGDMDERPVWVKGDFFGTVFGGEMAE